MRSSELLTNTVFGAVELPGELVTVTQDQLASPHVDRGIDGEVTLMVVLHVDCPSLHGARREEGGDVDIYTHTIIQTGSLHSYTVDCLLGRLNFVNNFSAV